MCQENLIRDTQFYMSTVLWQSSNAQPLFDAGYGGTYQLGTGINPYEQRMPSLIQDGGSATYHAVSCGESHTCALRSDGTMLCFGDNSEGKCGDGTANYNVQTPTEVAGGIVFKRIAAGGTHTCGLRASDGRAMCFGAWVAQLHRVWHSVVEVCRQGWLGKDSFALFAMLPDACSAPVPPAHLCTVSRNSRPAHTQMVRATACAHFHALPLCRLWTCAWQRQNSLDFVVNASQH